MLELSEVLKSTGNEVLVALYQDSNDYYLDIPHLDLTYASNGNRVNVTGTARVTSTDGQAGKYKGSFQVNYLRANVTALTGIVVQFPFSSVFPFTFATLAAALKAQYGLVVEAQDVLVPNTTNQMTDATQITAAMPVGGVIELKIADKSPRFIPKSLGGGSFYIKVVDPNGGQLDYLTGTTTLGPVTTLDA